MTRLAEVTLTPEEACALIAAAHALRLFMRQTAQAMPPDLVSAEEKLRAALKRPDTAAEDTTRRRKEGAKLGWEIRKAKENRP